MSADMYFILDMLIVKAVSESNATPYHNNEVYSLASKIATQNIVLDPMRIADRRMQLLRKAGVIRFLRKKDAPGGNAGWYLGDSSGGGA